MDLKQLQFLVAVVDHGGVGRAARHMNVSQSAVSQSLARLEDEVQAALFTRTKKGLVLTPYGTAMVSRARNMLHEAHSALKDIETLRGMGRGQLIIGTGPGSAATVVAEGVRQLLISRPELHVSVVRGGLDALGAELDHGEIDVAILTGEPSLRARQLTGEWIKDDPVTMYARTGHALLSRKSPTLSDTNGYSWVIPNSISVKQKLEALFSEAGLPSPKIQVETSFPGLIKAILEKSDYLTFSPCSIVTNEIAGASLQQVPIPGVLWHRPLHAVYPHSRALSKTARQFIDLLLRINAP